ncbi:hypothetical protein CW304_21440 [Bacillus sp. UFRGS-B20]|nr:hypothetical protein CW304_21440 [Bacillus sp. UFRGS-B20]
MRKIAFYLVLRSFTAKLTIFSNHKSTIFTKLTIIHHACFVQTGSVSEGYTFFYQHTFWTVLRILPSFCISDRHLNPSFLVKV